MKLLLKFFTLSLSGFLLVGPALSATVTWDGGGDEVRWTDPLNWDSNAVPKAGDEVVIGTAGSGGVIFSGELDLKSLQCTSPLSLSDSASLRVTSGASRIQGTVSLENNATLSAINPSTTLTLTALSIEGTGSLLQAGGGALITLLATTITLAEDRYFSLTAADSDSKLDFSAVTSLSLDNDAHLELSAYEGGYIDLKSALTPTAGKVGLTSQGLDSVIDLSAFSGALPSPSGVPGAQWWVYNEGSVLTGNLTHLSLSFLRLRDPGTFDLSSLIGFTGDIQVAGRDLSFVSLTTIAGSVTVTGGTKVSFPALTQIALGEDQSLALTARQPGSTIDFSQVTSLNFAAAKTYLELSVYEGATIDLKNASQPSHGEIRLNSYDSDSVIDLSAFSGELLFPELPPDDPGPGSQWWIYGGGSVRTGPLTGLSLTLLFLEAPGTFDLSTLTHFTGELQISDASLNFPALTTVVGSVSAKAKSQVNFPAVSSVTGNIEVLSGSIMTFPAFTTITLGDLESLSLNALGVDFKSGAASVLDLSAVTSLDLSTHAHLHLTALVGGQIKLPNALKPATGEIGLFSYGTGSEIDLSAFSGDLTFSSVWLGSDWTIWEEGIVRTGTLTGLTLSSLDLDEAGTFPLSNLNRFSGFLTVSYSPLTFPVLTQLQGTVYAYAGAQIEFPALTTLSLGDNEVLSFRSSNNESLIDLSAVTTIESTPSSHLTLTSTATGKIDMRQAAAPQMGTVSLLANLGVVDVSSMRVGCLPVPPNGSYSIEAINEGEVLIIPNVPPIALDQELSVDRNHTISIPISKLVRDQPDADCSPFVITVPSKSSQEGGIVAVVESAITYTPPPDFAGGDVITYAIDDQHGGTARGTIRVTVRQPTEESHTVAIRTLSNGHLLITFAALPNTAYRVQFSSDLKKWTILSRPIFTGPNGLLEFEDDLSVADSPRFYSLIK